MVVDVFGLSRFTEPMQELVRRAAAIPEAADPREETYWTSNYLLKYMFWMSRLQIWIGLQL